MAFPTTSILDSFTRANGALGSNWTSPLATGDSAPNILSNTVVGVAATWNGAYWNPATYLDSEAFISVPSASTAFDTGLLYCRSRNANTGTGCAYLIEFSATVGVKVYRLYNNTFSAALASYATNITLGCKVGLRVMTSSGNIVIETWADTGSGWTLLGTYTDTGAVATYPNLASAGNIGFRLYGNGYTEPNRHVDDFGGGTYVAVTLDDCLPDADVTTTGWTATPLFSKVNDASDATIMTATAS